MRRRKAVPGIIFVMLVATLLQGCDRFRATGGAHTKQTRPITIVLVFNNGQNRCEARFGKRAQHAFAQDTIAWEFVNSCPADKSVTLEPKGTSTNPFTTSPPWTISIRAGDTQELALDVSASALGSYGFDITVDGTKYDPKLEIDP